jgi:hypothetical protein
LAASICKQQYWEGQEKEKSDIWLQAFTDVINLTVLLWQAGCVIWGTFPYFGNFLPI